MHDNKGIGSTGAACRIVRVEMLRVIDFKRPYVSLETGYIIRQ